MTTFRRRKDELIMQVFPYSLGRVHPLAIEMGAAYLDEHFGRDWESRINLFTLDLQNYRTCLLGQLSGSYSEYTLVHGLTMKWAEDHGFMAPVSESKGVRDWRGYTAAWKQFIKDRKQAKKLEIAELIEPEEMPIPERELVLV